MPMHNSLTRLFVSERKQIVFMADEKSHTRISQRLFAKKRSEMRINMQTQVKEWGNSQGIRIPKSILEEANIAINDILDVNVSNGRIILVKPLRHRTLEERAEEYGGRIELDGEYDWGEKVGKEKWE